MGSQMNNTYVIITEVPDVVVQNASHCTDTVPTAKEVFHFLGHSPGHLAFVIVLMLAAMATFIIFMYDSVQICRRYSVHEFRAKRTVYIMAMYPVLAISSLMGVVVPNSATLVDLVSNSYIATSLYALMRLVTDFMGGPEELSRIICQDGAVLSFRSPPCCCCCFCLPTVKVTRRVLVITAMMVLQTAVVRPILMFFAAVAWADGNYIPGDMSPNTPCLYITILNTASNLLAVYGLLLKRNMVGKYLEQFRVSGKIITFQLTILSGVLSDLIIGIVASQGLIPCTPFLPSKENVARVQHAAQVFLSLILIIFASFNFKHRKDAAIIYHGPLCAENGTKHEVDDVIAVKETGSGQEETWDTVSDPNEETAMRDHPAESDRQPINV